MCIHSFILFLNLHIVYFLKLGVNSQIQRLADYVEGVLSLMLETSAYTGTSWGERWWKIADFLERGRDQHLRFGFKQLRRSFLCLLQVNPPMSQWLPLHNQKDWWIYTKAYRQTHTQTCKHLHCENLGIWDDL